MSITDFNPAFMIDVNNLINLNSLTTLLQMDALKILFILISATEAFNCSPKRYYPAADFYFPYLFGENVSNETLKYFFNYIPWEYFIECLKNNYSRANCKDTDLFDDYRNLFPDIDLCVFYRILYFTIFTNQIGFSENRKNLDAMTVKFDVTNNLNKETSFESIKKPSKILFHGTSFENMYSIARNGIMSMSKTKFQSNGAVYGCGIYLSSRLYEALCYVGKAAEKHKIVLCYEVKNWNPKHGTIHVQQEQDVLLKSIIWIKGEITNLSDFEDRIIHSLSSEKSFKNNISFQSLSLNEGYSKSCHQNVITVKHPELEPKIEKNVSAPPRVEKEYKRLVESVGKGDIIRVNFCVPDNKETPLYIEKKIPENVKLYNQASRLGISSIVFGVYLPANYPFIKPEIRVIRPIFRRQTGHVTVGGSICVDFLYADSWSTQTTIENCLTSIMNLISEGTSEEDSPGVIDETRIGQEYSYEDYKKSYSATGVAHGWNWK